VTEDIKFLGQKRYNEQEHGVQHAAAVDHGEGAENPNVEEEAQEQAREKPTLPPPFRPPAVVTETRIPNLLLPEATKLEAGFVTVVVVQGDSVGQVVEDLARLRQAVKGWLVEGGNDEQAEA